MWILRKVSHSHHKSYGLSVWKWSSVEYYIVIKAYLYIFERYEFNDDVTNGLNISLYNDPLFGFKVIEQSFPFLKKN